MLFCQRALSCVGALLRVGTLSQDYGTYSMATDILFLLSHVLSMDASILFTHLHAEALMGVRVCWGLTALRVGFPLKKAVFSRFLGGVSRGFRKKHPLAMASRGAGPS